MPLNLPRNPSPAAFPSLTTVAAAPRLCLEQAPGGDVSANTRGLPVAAVVHRLRSHRLEGALGDLLPWKGRGWLWRGGGKKSVGNPWVERMGGLMAWFL